MTRSRFGRVIKKPVLYIPVETVLDDDYATDDHDDSEDDSVIDTEDEYNSEEGSHDDYDEDADEIGNLKDCVVEDESESEEESA